MTTSNRIWLPLVAVLFIGASVVATAADGSCASDVQGNSFFSSIPEIRYEGPESRNPFAFRFYNKDEVIMGKPMKEWFRFSVAFWHSFCGDGSDPFGSGTKTWPWNDPKLDEMGKAEARMRANFELMGKLGVEYWCFHDRDIAPKGATLRETNANLDKIVVLAKELQAGTPIRPLWGTAQLFKDPVFMHGAATSPQAEVFALAAAQVKKAIEVTHTLGGIGYNFWGGREGYTSFLTTQMGREIPNMARFLKMAVDFKRSIGFNGTLLIEPKPKEPTHHQYDFDVAHTLNFLRQYGLDKEFSLQIECNHATLAGHSCAHELEVARLAGRLGGVDANTGDLLVGWDTDEFLTNPADTIRIGLVILRSGGIPGGFNFDAKLRRESVSVEDLVVAHVSGMDEMARGLRTAAAIIEDGKLDRMISDKYKSWDGGIGAQIEKGKVGFKELEDWVMNNEDAIHVSSGKQEYAERLVMSYL